VNFFGNKWSARAGALFVAIVSSLYGASLILARFGYQASSDSHYHFAVARELARGHFRSELAPRLPWTILTELPVDHYFGFHLLLAPFAFLPGVWGLKLATLAFFVAVPCLVYGFLRARQARFIDAAIAQATLATSRRPEDLRDPGILAYSQRPNGLP